MVSSRFIAPSTDRMARTKSAVALLLGAGFFIFGISNGGRRNRRGGRGLIFFVSYNVKSALSDDAVAPREQRPQHSGVRVRHQQCDMECLGKNRSDARR